MPQNEDYSLLFARICDAVKLAQQKNCPEFVGFLSEPEYANVLQFLKSAPFVSQFGKSVQYCFFGGYKNAQRVFFAALPDWATSENDISFPLTAVRLCHRAGFTLLHKDYLGAIMAQGIERNRVGDIIVNDDDAVVILHSSVAEHIIMQLDKIGRVGITASDCDSAELVVNHSYNDISASIASDRLDCVVAALACTSREKAVDLINARLVFVNGLECQSVSKKIAGEDTITIRKKGKFIIDSVAARTKKGRTVLNARQII